MSRWALVGVLCVLGAGSGTAFGQADVGDGVPGVEPAPVHVEVGVTALPGGDHIGYADSLPAGTVSTAFSAGFGYRSGLLASSHKMSRGAATAAIAYSITDFLSVGLLLDGRYDKHSGTGFDDDGWVGEPRLHVRAGKAQGNVAFGGELTVWTPGKDAPSVVPKATSVDARALVSTRLANGLRLAANAGFRLDNSAKSVDNAMDLSTPDQASLGVSQWNAIVGGVRVAYPAGKKLVLGFESEVDAYVGGPSGRPRPSILIGASVSYQLTPGLTAELFLASNIQEKPTVSAMGTIPLIPYGPLVAGGLGIQARFGGPHAQPAPLPVAGCDDPDPARRPADCKVEPPKPVVATLAGRITDEDGAPLAGVKVTITDCDGKVTAAVTDADGRYKAEQLKPCEATVALEADGKVPSSQKVSLKEGDNPGDTALAPVVPPGRIRGLIRSFATGKGIEATVEINPGGKTMTTAADGTFEVDVAPGTYTVKITAAGMKDQTREYVVEQHGVAIVNVDLRK